MRAPRRPQSQCRETGRAAADCVSGRPRSQAAGRSPAASSSVSNNQEGTLRRRAWRSAARPAVRRLWTRRGRHAACPPSNRHIVRRAACPSRIRRAATQCVRGWRSVPAMTAATSPGNTRSITNTSADRPTKAATNSASRFPTNRMEIPFPYLFLEIRHNGSTVWLSLLGKPCTCLSTATVTR